MLQDQRRTWGVVGCGGRLAVDNQEIDLRYGHGCRSRSHVYRRDRDFDQRR